MSVILKNDNYLRMPLDGSASFTTAPFQDLDGMRVAWLFLEYTADADELSTLGFRFSVDSGALATYPIPFASVAAAGFYAPERTNLPALVSNALPFTGLTSAGSFFIELHDPPPNLQFIYTRGGGSRQFLVSIFGRS